jgi:hypothetical protein
MREIKCCSASTRCWVVAARYRWWPLTLANNVRALLGLKLLQSSAVQPLKRLLLPALERNGITVAVLGARLPPQLAYRHLLKNPPTTAFAVPRIYRAKTNAAVNVIATRSPCEPLSPRFPQTAPHPHQPRHSPPQHLPWAPAASREGTSAVFSAEAASSPVQPGD